MSRWIGLHADHTVVRGSQDVSFLAIPPARRFAAHSVVRDPEGKLFDVTLTSSDPRLPFTVHPDTEADFLALALSQTRTRLKFVSAMRREPEDQENALEAQSMPIRTCKSCKNGSITSRESGGQEMVNASPCKGYLRSYSSVLPAGNFAIPERSNRVDQFGVASPMRGIEQRRNAVILRPDSSGHDLRELQMIKAPLNLPSGARWAVASAAILLVIAVHNIATDGQRDQPVDDHEAIGAGNWYFAVAPTQPDALPKSDYFFFGSQGECEKRWRELKQDKTVVVASACRITIMRPI